MKTSIQLTVGAIVVIAQTAVLVKMIRTETAINEVSKSINEVSGRLRIVEDSILKKTNEKIVLSDKEFSCLAKNVFYEAGVEDLSGKIAVAMVTMNRKKDHRWGDTVCGAVYAKSQFSWTLQKNKLHQVPRGKLWDKSVIATHKYLNGYRVVGLENSKFYHTDYIKQPKWVDKKLKVGVVGQHIFYSEARKA